MMELRHLAKYSRFLLEKTNLLIVRGGIEPVLSGMRAYNERHNIATSDVKPDVPVRELLAAAAVSAVSLADRESWGWSLTFKGSKVGYFVGVEPEGMICLRAVDAGGERASVIVQRQKAGLPLTQSFLKPRNANPRNIAEQYFSEVVQIKTRAAIREDGEGILVQALPGGDFDFVQDLNPEELFSFADSSIDRMNAKNVGEVLLFYECRCSEAMISRMIQNMKEADRRDLFRDSNQIEIECPRCGRKYLLGGDAV
jgi:hypothetical protein